MQPVTSMNDIGLLDELLTDKPTALNCSSNLNIALTPYLKKWKATTSKSLYSKLSPSSIPATQMKQLFLTNPPACHVLLLESRNFAPGGPLAAGGVEPRVQAPHPAPRDASWPPQR